MLEADEVVTCFRDGVVTLRKNRRESGYTESLKEIGYQGIRAGDLVIHSMDAFAGAIGIADSDGKGSPVYSVCKPRPQVNAYFCAYILREMARNGWIQALAKGIRERSSDFRYSDFATQLVPLPPLPEQAAIVRFLDHADRRIRRYIRAKKKLIELLEEQKQVTIHQAVTGQIDVRTGQPYPSYKDSDTEWLGEVPEHWEVRRLKQVAKIQSGFAFSSELFGQDGIPVIRMNNIQRGVLQTDDAVRVPEQQCKGAFALKEGDILYGLSGSIGATGSLGNYAIVSKTDLPAQLNQRVARLQPVQERLVDRFLVNTIQTASFYAQVLSKTSGTAQFNVSTGDIGNVAITLPPFYEQQGILQQLSCAVAEIETAKYSTSRQINLLDEYRTRLIADVVTGKLDVREAAAGLSEEDVLRDAEESAAEYTDEKSSGRNLDE